MWGAQPFTAITRVRSYYWMNSAKTLFTTPLSVLNTTLRQDYLAHNLSQSISKNQDHVTSLLLSKRLFYPAAAKDWNMTSIQWADELIQSHPTLLLSQASGRQPFHWNPQLVVEERCPIGGKLSSFIRDTESYPKLERSFFMTLTQFLFLLFPAFYSCFYELLRKSYGCPSLSKTTKHSFQIFDFLITPFTFSNVIVLEQFLILVSITFF